MAVLITPTETELEYLVPITKNLLLLDHACQIKIWPRYIHPQINEFHRTVCVDYIHGLGGRFCSSIDTNLLAIVTFDSYMTLRSPIKESVKEPEINKELRLICISCYFLAYQFQEVEECSFQEMIDELPNNGYSGMQDFKDHVINKQMEVFRTIKYKLTVPTSITFLRILVIVSETTKEVYQFAKYIIELSTLDRVLYSEPSFVLAISALYISRKMYNLSPLIPDGITELFSGYNVLQSYIDVVVMAMELLLKNPTKPILSASRKFTTVYDKYKEKFDA
jgi:hypothetical protein